MVKENLQEGGSGPGERSVAESYYRLSETASTVDYLKRLSMLAEAVDKGLELDEDEVLEAIAICEAGFIDIELLRENLQKRYDWITKPVSDSVAEEEPKT